MFKVNKNDVTDFVNFEHISHFFLTFLLLTSSMYLFAGDALNEFLSNDSFWRIRTILVKIRKTYSIARRVQHHEELTHQLVFPLAIPKSHIFFRAVLGNSLFY